MVSCLLKAQPVLSTVTLTLVNSPPCDRFRLDISCCPGESSDPCHGLGAGAGVRAGV